MAMVAGSLDDEFPILLAIIAPHSLPPERTRYGHHVREAHWIARRFAQMRKKSDGPCEVFFGIVNGLQYFPITCQQLPRVHFGYEIQISDGVVTQTLL